MLSSLLLQASLEVVLEQVLACATHCGLEPESFGEHEVSLQDPGSGLGLRLRFEPGSGRGDRWLVLGTPIPPESLAGLERLDQLMRCLRSQGRNGD